MTSTRGTFRASGGVGVRSGIAKSARPVELLSPTEGVWAVELGVAGVADQSGSRPPQVDQTAGRLQGECERRAAFAKIEPDLVGGAGHGCGHRARPPHLNRPVKMTAQHALDLGMAPNYFGQRV